MNARILPLLLFGILASASVMSQGLQLKLQLMPEGNRWGVFVKPVGVTPGQTITGSGQATIVMPNGFGWQNLESHSGQWINNASIISPAANPERQYISFGLNQAEPLFPIVYKPGQETLLFTFDGDGSCPDTLHLIDCNTISGVTDLYCPELNPNGGMSNPGNDLVAICMGAFACFNIYHFEDNYAPSAWSCHDNDADGTPNALEDSNGDGQYTPGVDVGDLNVADVNGLHLKLQLMPSGNRWGVYVKPVGISPSGNLLTGTGQVTVVMPKNFQWSGLQNAGGQWINDSNILGPAENPNRKYVSFGLIQAEPLYPINIASGQETLLFSFQSNECPDSLWLVDCNTVGGNDPFCPDPSNSVGTNPGNDLGIIDIGVSPFKFYEFKANYAKSGWSCHDNDNDGTLNAHEDTNGDGQYTPGVDVSDLNGSEQNVDGLHLKLQLMPGGNRWGVYAKPVGISPSANTVTGSGQVTIVMPKDFVWDGLENVSGQWLNDANVTSPAQNPACKYVSFGLNQAEPLYPIPFAEGQETLLFSFSGTTCPDSLYLMDCNTPSESDPFCPPNSQGNNPGNSLTVMDFDNDFEIYAFSDLYAPSAWNCHDCDNDGTPNALEDTNGDGQWTPGTDASNLCAVSGCLEMKIKYLKAQQKWGVYVRPQAGFSPSANAQTQAGQVTIVAPSDFAFANFTSVAGQWSQLLSVVSPAANPGMTYTTFKFAPGTNPINYAAASETLLFTFKRTGDCPDSLYLWEPGNAYPALPNLLTGLDPNQAQGAEFSLCGVYGRNQWKCPGSGGGIIIVPTDQFPDSLGNGGNGSLAFAAGEKTDLLQLSPNPAGDFLQVKIFTENTDNRAVVHLLNLHGQPLQRHLAEGRNELQLDLNGLPAGLYFLALEVDGKVQERRRFIKK